MELLPLSDKRWKTYRSGYKECDLDVTGWLRKLSSGDFDESHWNYLWNELHHQNDVGEASYAVVPYLAVFAKKHNRFDWHLFAFPVVVELARLDISGSPMIPDEIRDTYYWGIKELANIAVTELEEWDDVQAPCMSACIALAKGHPIYARAYLEMASIDLAKDYLKNETGWENEA
jgi:hypothetical protein